MKKNHFAFPGVLLVTALLLTACEKETSEKTLQAPQTALQAGTVKLKNECRVTQIIDYDRISYYGYNNLGLVNNWDIVEFGTYTISYDATGKPAHADFYSGSELLWTIDFFYKGERIYKEVWFYIPTNQVWDEYYYTYNSKGLIIKGESTQHDYVINNQYTPEGNLSYWEFVQSGNIVLTGEHTYDQPIKNPRRAAQGIIYDFPYYDSALTFSKWWYSSAKFTVYDENGTPETLLNFDPSQTAWVRGHQNYPISVSYFDMVSGQSWPLVSEFSYDNCDPGNENSNAVTSSSAEKGAGRSGRSPLFTRNPLKSIKQQVAELRQQAKK